MITSVQTGEFDTSKHSQSLTPPVFKPTTRPMQVFKSRRQRKLLTVMFIFEHWYSRNYAPEFEHFHVF